ncbi:hypothetical protein BDV24DRAFT_61383 [Aspergillus arachidicola]|uniref:Cytochrome P450 n=1 Tax=Aspergillus arachidicola TaxID=656916 RepID=A0A5N6YAN8_9EURO|nr:hypothetical protein BDV24DRAFT_61383 [Aspergillus arachidicola]
MNMNNRPAGLVSGETLSLRVAECFILVLTVLYLPYLSISLITLSAVFVHLFVCIVYRAQIYPRYIDPLRHLPTANGGHPIIGHVLSQFSLPRGEKYLSYVDTVPNDGIIRLRGFLNSSQLLLTNAEALKEVLVRKAYEFEKPSGERDFLRVILGEGLVVSEGDFHKYQRKRVLPSFSLRQIKGLHNIFWRMSQTFSTSVEHCIREQIMDSDNYQFLSGVVDIDNWAPRITLDIIGIAALGREFNSLQNSDDALFRAYNTVTAPTLKNLGSLGLYAYGPRWLASGLSRQLGMNDTANMLRVYGHQFLEDKRTAVEADPDRHFDILSELLKSGEFTDTDLVDQLLTFIAAGHETTSSTFSWVIYLLALHREVQERLRDEIDAHVHQIGTNASGAEIAAILDSLPVLNAVCNETLRLYPTVPISFRVPNRDTSILGYPVRKGTRIIISPWAINRSRQHWGPDADKFVPERWIDPKTGKPNNTGGATNNYSLLTFLHGPRSCIGQSFAKAELKCLIVAFLTAFEVLDLCSAGPVVPGGAVTTKPIGGMQVRLKIRNKI